MADNPAREAQERAPERSAPSTTAPGGEAPRPFSDPLSAMTPRFNLFFRWFARRFFGHFDLDDETVAQLRELEARGAVIYVMRYSSRLDYFLFNTLFLREGLRLSGFANGIRFYYYRPLWRSLRAALLRPRGRPREVRQSDDREKACSVMRSGGSLFLFLRTARLRSFLRGRRARPRHEELDLLESLVRAAWEDDRPVSVVPLSVFWRKGPRAESRFLNLQYGALTRPSDLLKVSSFLATYRSLVVKCGEPIDLTGFIGEHRHEGPARVARKVRRSLLTYLWREEKVVEGPTLRARNRVCEEVLTAPAVRAAIEERSRGRRGSVERATRDAERMFREIAANMNSTFLAALSVAVTQIFRRMFASIEVEGLERVAEHARSHPIVLVPSHRSYFDFLILSWLFYQNFMVPPHIAARENMAFGPFGFIFRRAGAFFLRRSFDDPLYKEVFRAYVAYLVREGFTQEFFIEGGRSRTGKTLAPRLGMLSWDVEAFLAGSRRDLFFVPVAITYERLVEEGAMIDELEGGAKQEESMLGLVRARKTLQRRFGSVHVSFDEPISLAEAVGGRREELAREGGGEDRRRFVEELGLRLVERINWSAVANATSVAACVLLGTSGRGLRRAEMVRRMQLVVDLLRLEGVRLTPALTADQGSFRESIAFLQRSDLLKARPERDGEILYFDESRRRALDLYRNSIAHYLATPSLMARRLLTGATRKELREDLLAWQEMLYQEFYVPRHALVARAEALLEHFEGKGWVQGDGDHLVASEAGMPVLEFLAEQTRGLLEAYRAACDVAADRELEATRKDFLAAASDRYTAARLLGEATRIEAANETTFQNALDLLVRQGVLEWLRKESPERRGRRPAPVLHVRPGPHHEALGSLRQRLDAALEARRPAGVPPLR